MNDPVILNIEGLSFSYDEGKDILRGYSIIMKENDRFHLSAASGAGKTTLLRLIAGLEKPREGTIALTAPTAYLFQEDRLLPWSTVLENLTLTGASRAEALEALDDVGLSGAEGKKPGELSGGMKRRAALARLFVYAGRLDHPLLLLDEPFAGVDGENRQRCVEAFERRFPENALLLATHIPEEAVLMRAETRTQRFLL